MCIRDSNIAEYNEKFTSRRLNPHNGHRYLPYIVVVVDEFADLIMTAREVEGPVMRLAQKARAIGIHLIIATQRPDVKVITGGIKANFPARIAFRVMQMIDSRTIIDQPGANQLIGRGDMLFSKDGELTRIQCALVETKEVERVVDYISRQQGYTEAYPLPDYTPDADGGGSSQGSEDVYKRQPHNFVELINACIAHLQGREFQLYPDFPTGGMADVSRYNDGLRGGAVKVRAKISKIDKRTLAITEIPYTTTTESIKDSIIKANDKGKIKIKKVDDNTACLLYTSLAEIRNKK